MKTANRKVWLILPIIVALVMVALAPVTSNPVAAQDEFRVAVITPSATDDLAFSQSIIDALDVLSEEMDGFSYDFQDNTFIVEDATAALFDWARSGDYDLIIAHGSQFGPSIEEVAPQFPEIAFVWGTDVNTFGLDNVSAYEAASDQGGYVMGVLAANMSESGVIGVVGPIEVGDAKLFVDGFVAGVAGADTGATTLDPIYTGSFGDVALATEAANTLLDNGADILTGTAQMVVGAIGVAQENDVLWFGTQSSQAELAGEVGVAFQIYHWEVVLREIIANIADGDYGGESYQINFENGGLTLEWGEYEVSEELQALADETIQGIIDGSIVPLPAEEEMEATEESDS